MINQSPLIQEPKITVSQPTGHRLDKTRDDKNNLEAPKSRITNLDKAINGQPRVSGVSNQATHDGPNHDSGNNLSTDGPELAANGQLKINGVGNNLAKDGPINGSGNNKPTDGPKNQKPSFDDYANKWKKFSEKYILPNTTIASVIFNLISAPLRLFGRDSIIAKFLNKVSLGFTKLHQLGYAATGIGTALSKKNLFYVLSFGLEALVALLPLRRIYLFKGMASALDILPTCIKKYTSDKFKTFRESLPKTISAIYSAMKEVFKNPQIMLSKDSLDKQWPIIGAGLSIVGNIIGFGGKDTLGGAIRDVGAILNDFGLLFNSNSTAIRSGKYYLGGSTIDLAANGIGKFGQSQGSSNGFFGNLRDAIHEIALASDRWGQKHFIHYLNEVDEQEHKQEETAKKLHSKPEPKAHEDEMAFAA